MKDEMKKYEWSYPSRIRRSTDTLPPVPAHASRRAFGSSASASASAFACACVTEGQVCAHLQLQLVDIAGEEIVRRALIDEELEGRAGVRLGEERGIVRLAGAHGAEVAAEGLIAPRAVGRVADW